MGNTVKIYILLNISDILGGHRHLRPLHLKVRRRPFPAVSLHVSLRPCMFAFHDCLCKVVDVALFTWEFEVSQGSLVAEMDAKQQMTNGFQQDPRET